MIEWCLVILAIALVIACEAINTAIEFLTDRVSTEPHPLAGKAKDVAAGAVLVASMGAAVIGAIDFWPENLAVDFLITNLRLRAKRGRPLSR